MLKKDPPSRPRLLSMQIRGDIKYYFADFVRKGGNYLGLSGSVWDCLGLSGTFCGILWDYLGLSGTVLDCLGLSWSRWDSLWDSVVLSRTVWDSLGLSGLSGSLSETLWDCLGLSGTLWDYLGLSGTVGECVGLCGSVWDSLWNFLGLSGTNRRPTWTIWLHRNSCKHSNLHAGRIGLDWIYLRIHRIHS